MPVNAETHEKFKAALEESTNAVWLAARILSGKGFHVRINASRVAPTHDVRHEYGDDGDLEISQKVEVKRISRNFTGSNDWPFGDEVIVDGKNNFDKKFPAPAYYICFSKDLEHYLVIDVNKTRSSWYATEKRNPMTGDMQEFLCVPKAKCVFRSTRETGA